MDNHNEYARVEDLFCMHEFTVIGKDGKPICQSCSMEAELYYERKFETKEEFIEFLIGRML